MVQFLIRLGLVVGLSASLWGSMLGKMSGNSYVIGEGNSGYYFPYDQSSNMWFLYMPSANYLFVHPSGEATSGQTLSASDFSSLVTSGDEVSFGSYSGSSDQGYQLANRTFSIMGDNGGFYQEFDSASRFWFLYIPVSEYLILHESGKSSLTDSGTEVFSVSKDGVDISYSGNVVQLGSVGTDEAASSSDSAVPVTTERADGTTETVFAGITWLTPNDDTCKRYGDNYSIDGWQTTSIIMTESFSIDYCNSRGGRALAESVCSEIGARLPTMAEFTQLVEACGGVMEDYVNNSRNTEYSECMQQARFEEQSYISSEVSGNQVLALDIVWGKTREKDESDDLVYRCVADSSITPTSSESSQSSSSSSSIPSSEATGSVSGMRADGYFTMMGIGYFTCENSDSTYTYTYVDGTVTCSDLGTSTDYSGSFMSDLSSVDMQNGMMDGAVCLELHVDGEYAAYAADKTCIAQVPLEETMTE